MVVERIAELLADIEEHYHRLQAEAAAAATGPRPRPPTICMPVIDRAQVVAVFVDRGAIHIVWNDEYVPVPAVDEAYRRVRCLKYGRKADVETVIVADGVAEFPYTLGEPQPYETSLHFSGRKPYRGVIYSWTWNHMLSTIPSPWVLVRGGYECTRSYMLLYGDRDRAERLAEQLGC